MLSKKLYEAEISYKHLLETSAQTKTSNSKKVSQLKDEVDKLKKLVLKDRAEFEKELANVGNSIVEGAKNVCKLQSKAHARELECREKEYHEKVAIVQQALELEHDKISDCNREVEMYRQQITETSTEIDRLKAEHAEAKELWAQNEEAKILSLNNEKAETTKKLMLDHEFELESLREAINNDERITHYETQLKKLKGDLATKSSELDTLKKKTRLLETSQEEKLNFEKDKIVQILETGFAQREKLAMQKVEAELVAKNMQQVEQMSMDFGKKLIDELEKADEQSKEEAAQRVEALEAEHKDVLARLKGGTPDFTHSDH